MFRRLIKYYKINGFGKTIGHSFAVVLRMTIWNKYFIYCYNLKEMSAPSKSESYEVIFKKNFENIEASEKESMARNGNRGIDEFDLRARYEKGANIWLLKSDGEVLGFIWSIFHEPIAPYFFPLFRDDVHLFDNEIFVKYRGKGLNTILVSNVLFGLRSTACRLAYIETAMWNGPEQRSLKKMRFSRIGFARKLRIFGRNVIVWGK